MLKLYNTLSRKVESFKPIKEKQVSFYSCGPTVYNYAHIGNLRTFIFNDTIKRSLTFLGYNVKHVMNITDVDDKTIKGSQKDNQPLKGFTEKYEKIFFNDLEELNIIRPEYIPKATENISEMIEMISILLKKEIAYKTEDGIYFSIKKSKGYGKLAQLEKIKSSKSRISSDEYSKENPRDFALWKFHSKEDGEVKWHAPFGEGRPGWHIECSAMSTKILGKTIDIHSGAIDLIFPHHTNEIAQSESCTNKKFVKYWLHGGFLTLKDSKMSKSLGNIIYLKDIKSQGYSPLDFRYLCLSNHYRSPLIFSIENLESAKNSYQRLKNIILELEDDKEPDKKYLEDFKKAIEDDLNTPKALSVMWNLIRDEKAKGKLNTIKEMDKVLGLRLLDKQEIVIPKEIQELAQQREEARKNKDWKKADELRNIIKSKGFIIEDSQSGIKIKRE